MPAPSSMLAGPNTPSATPAPPSGADPRWSSVSKAVEVAAQTDLRKHRPGGPTAELRVRMVMTEKRVWNNIKKVPSESYVCWNCGNRVASSEGYSCDVANWPPSPGRGTSRSEEFIRVCPHCCRPTYFAAYGRRIPGTPPGAEVEHLPEDVGALYRDARLAAGASAYTAATLTCRKLLMHVAVEQGAPEGATFQACVEHLAAQNVLPANAKGWVDHLRLRGNEANHEIILMQEKDSTLLLDFAEMLLRLVYEFPSRVPAAKPGP